jgi:ribonuclease HI
MCLFFARFVLGEADVVPVTYADNWQVIARQVGPIVTVLPKIHEFLELCALPVSPEKCWLWSAGKIGRKRLKQVAFGDSHIPVRLQAVDLGADMPYCKRRAAAKRNLRIKAGHRRLQRAKGLPGSKWQKSRLIMSGIWPQCLHGSETCVVPKSVLKRLRTQAGRVASIAKQGVSPWLACSVGSPQLVDPEFCLLVQRLRLFRLMWRDFPDARPRMQKGLCALRSATRGVSFLLSRQLRSFEWIVQGLVASDDHGRCFHLVNTPLKAVKRVLESSWLQNVGSNLTHRKDCGEIQVIDAELSKVWQRFPLGDRSLLLSQLTGVTFTRDCLAHAEGVQVSNACPLYGEPDSRLHRAKYCVAGGELRASLLKELDGQSLPDHTWAYGIWDETVGLRDWQAQLCGLELPQVFTSSCEARQFVFTDGSCLFPTKPKLSLSGGAVILASPGAYQVVWAGIVPGLDQSSYRAEVLAICVAVGSFGKVTIFCDNSAVVRIAEQLLRLPAWQRGHRLPHEHRDLWEYFCQVSTHQSWGQVVIRWVKAHQNPAELEGHQRILALFNSYADREAKTCVRAFARGASYQALFQG